MGSFEHPGDPQSELAGRADTLCRRLIDIEQALAEQEWWLLGRALPEARLLAEVTSLLAVARGELENTLAQYFGHPITRSDFTDQFNALTTPSAAQTHDPVWLAARRDQAIRLLRLVASSLPPMLQYGQMLRAYTERAGLARGAVDAFGIVADRLGEAYEALREPPQ
jgi:hypothetical protein